MRRIVLLALSLVLAGLPPLSAHETWLAPSKFNGVGGEELRFDLTSGMDFPRIEYAIALERIKTARFRLGESDVDFTGKMKSTASSLRFSQIFRGEGLVTVWAVLQPHPLTLSDAKVKEYFAEIDAPNEVRKIWAQRKGHETWNETYTKCAKTFVALGEARDDQSWKTPVYMPLELVPIDSPLELTSGHAASFRLLENGEALTDCVVGLMTASNPKESSPTVMRTAELLSRCRKPGASCSLRFTFAR